MELLIVENQEKKSYSVDGNHSSQEGWWEANVVRVEEGDGHDDDVLDDNDYVHNQQFCVADTRLCVVTLDGNDVVVQVKIADPVDDALVEDVVLGPICGSAHRSPVDEGHGKHMQDSEGHHGPEVSLAPGEGKNDEDDQPGRDLANASGKKDKSSRKI